jgi:hypothetical protein
MNTERLIWAVVLTGALLAAACGDAKSSLPTAPSSVGAAMQAAEAGDSVSGTMGQGGNGNGRGNNGGGNGGGNNGGGSGNGNDGGNNNGGGNGNGNQPTVPTAPQPPTNTTPTTTRKVEIQGPISAKIGDMITVGDQQVIVPAACVIRHGDTRFTFSELNVGDLVHVRATRTTTGTGATATTTIEASEVKLQNPGFRDDDDDSADPTLLVSVRALDASAAEAGLDQGAFRFSRSGDTTAALTVTILIGGTAANGSDYITLPLTVTFEAGAATADVAVRPLADSATEGSETVIVTVVDGSGYEAGSPATATVNIAG